MTQDRKSYSDDQDRKGYTEPPMTTTADKATKRPWKVDKHGSICAVWENGIEVQVAAMAHTHWTNDHDNGKGGLYNQRIARESKANAALIVSAVNQHDALREENGRLREAVRMAYDILGKMPLETWNGIPEWKKDKIEQAALAGRKEG